MHDVLTGAHVARADRTGADGDAPLFPEWTGPSYKEGMPVSGQTRAQKRLEADSRPTRSGEERLRTLDKFYTTPTVALACLDYMRETLGREALDGAAAWLEPSAGAGAFLSLMPADRRTGVDMSPVPGVAGVIDHDFLTWVDGLKALPRPLIVMGNPPFGRNASLAIRFVNHIAQHGREGDLVCFILPRTFEKAATQHKLNDCMQQVGETMELPSESFTHDGLPYHVPCCFQIWRNMGANRRGLDTRPLEHPDFDVVGRDDEADFAFQRVGVHAGLVSREGLDKSWKSHHRIRAHIDAGTLFERLKGMGAKWAEIRARTAGNPSIGKRDLVEAYTEELRRLGVAPRAVGDRIGDNLSLDL